MISYKMSQKEQQKSSQQRMETDVEGEFVDLSHNLQQHPHNILTYKRAKKMRLRTLDHSEPIFKLQQPLDQFSFVSGQQDIRQAQKTCPSEMFKQFSQTKPITFLKKSLGKRCSSNEKDKKVSSNVLNKKAKSKSSGGVRLGDKYLMVWLNKILADYCAQDAIQEGRLKALQRFGIDKTALLSQGMSEGNIQKVYQTLFAHSMGFNTSLKELIVNPVTNKSIWKIYAILLEYCSDGYFQTMMGELERDMIKNNERLHGQIEKRQSMIDSTDERMEQKLKKFQRENKNLTKQLQRLLEKHTQMESDYFEIETSYNYEVNLRLAFQHKINKVYSIHERLNIVHQKLFKDFQETDEINQRVSKESGVVKNRNIELDVNFKEARAQVEELKRAISTNEAVIQGLILNEHELQNKLDKQITLKKEQVMDFRENQKRVIQLEQQLKSSNTIIQIMQGSSNGQLLEYKRLSNDNLSLKLDQSAKIQKIGELLNQINLLNSRQSSIRSELEYATKKGERLTLQLLQSKREVSSMVDRVDEAEVVAASKTLQVKQLAHVIQSLHINVKQLKKMFQKMEDRAESAEKYLSKLTQDFDAIHNNKLQFELQIKTLKEQKFQMELQLNQKIGEIIQMQKKHQIECQNYVNRYQKLQKVWTEQEDSSLSLIDKLTNSQNELEEARKMIDVLTQNFTNMTFEKTQFESLYNNNLILHDHQKQSQKELLIQISKYNQRLNQLQRQLASQAKNHQKKMKQIEREQDKLKSTIQRLQAYIVSKQGYVHPMLLQDVLQCLKREQDEHYRTRKRLEGQVQRLQDKNMTSDLAWRKREQDLKGVIKDLERDIDQVKYKSQRQLEYFKDKNNQLRGAIYDLQMKMQFHKGSDMVDQQKEAQDLMVGVFQQKNKQIKALFQQLERLQDSFQQKTQFYENQIKQIKISNKNTINTLTQTNHELQLKMVATKQEYQAKIQAKMQEIQEEQQRNINSKKRVSTENSAKGEKGIYSKRTEFVSRLKLASKYFNK